MTTKAILFFTVLCTIELQAQHHFPDKPSTHGMMMMGNEVVYASHLPMFHSPHDYQIILELRLSEADKAKYLTDRLAHTEELIYTLEPEVFVLPEMVYHTKIFKGSIYRGHFERGGTKIMDNISFVIEQVVYIKQFQEQEIRPPYLHYILFGNEKEQFLAHQIAAKPDFDEILSIRISDEDVIKKLNKSWYVVLEFKEADQRKAFSWDSNNAWIIGSPDETKVSDHKRLYLEFGDLD
jgi:hypothetical protein